MNEYRVVTISNRNPSEWYYTYPQPFLKSLQWHEPLILGQEPGTYTGLSDKPRILHKAISDGLIKEKIIVFVDAWDVVFAKPVDWVVDDYKMFQCPIVIGAEKNCFPSCLKKEYDKWEGHTTSYKYLNSGVIIGEVAAIYEILEAMDAPNLPVDYHDGRTGTNFHFNDQAYYADLFLRQPVEMALDYNCLIAQNMQDVTEDEIEFTELGIKNKETGTLPSIIHWNGSSKDKWSRNLILKHLNLI